MVGFRNKVGFWNSILMYYFKFDPDWLTDWQSQSLRSFGSKNELESRVERRTSYLLVGSIVISSQKLKSKYKGSLERIVYDWLKNKP